METVFLTAFFRFDPRGSEYGFERISLQHIWKTEKDARDHISFCDEAGWYEGVLIEKHAIGWEYLYRHERKRVWLIQEGSELKEIEQPKFYNDCVSLIG